MNQTKDTNTVLQDVAARIKELREICGYSPEQMAEFTDISVQEYLKLEQGQTEMPFTFVHKCARCFGVEIENLMEGKSAKLSSYTVTRKGKGLMTAKEDGIEIQQLAPLFRNKIAEPYWVNYEFSPSLQNKPIHLTTHKGQEFDFVIKGKLKVQVGDHIEILSEGDCIYYDSNTPHGMIAIDGQDCLFCAVVLPGEAKEESEFAETVLPVHRHTEPLIYEEFITVHENEQGALQSLDFHNTDNFNFAFDIIDVLAERKPAKLAMLHLDQNKFERRFTFRDMKRLSNKTANYFTSLGIKKGDRVMLVLRRNYHFWLAVLALQKIGAVFVPATDQLLEKDFEYRFNSGDISAIFVTAESGAVLEAEKAMAKCPQVKTKILTTQKREGWHCFDSEFSLFSEDFERTAESAGGNDPLLMFFTSGTTGYPKIAEHNHKYPLGHFITAKYWHCVNPNGIHFTISDTGWGKAIWGKLFGQWLCEAAVFTYDFDRFDAHDILPLFKKHNITTFCAPPTMYRFFIKEDLSKYDLSSIQHASTAGEALNPEVFHQFKAATGLSVMEGFGQTETTLTIANLVGTAPKIGSMGKAVPGYDLVILDADGQPAPIGETGEICIRLAEGCPNGLFNGYFRNPEDTAVVVHDGYYHTRDTAWKDEDGYFWYVGRVDDVIKSSGYRIGPFEIESVIMELPYVLECGVCGAPDEIRGQVVKASIVLVKGVEGTDELKKEIQNYVKTHTAPYKYPRIVEFRDELPKTISGKIQRNKL